MQKLTRIAASVWGAKDWTTDCVGYDLSDPAHEALRARVPAVDPEYMFRPRLLFHVLQAFKKEVLVDTGRPEHMPRRAIGLQGPPSAGKSSLVEQIAARLGVPVFTAPGGDKLSIKALFQSQILVGGTSIKQYGALAQAAMAGGWFLFNEANFVNPNDTGELYDFMERGVYTVPGTGEVIKAARGFMLFLTQNPSRGTAGMDGMINLGTREQANAFETRVDWIDVQSPTLDEEAEIIRRKVPGLDKRDAQRTAKLARGLRDSQLPKPFAMRQVLSFAAKYASLKTLVLNEPELAKHMAEPAVEALKVSYANLLPPEQQASAFEILKTHFVGAKP